MNLSHLSALAVLLALRLTSSSPSFVLPQVFDTVSNEASLTVTTGPLLQSMGSCLSRKDSQKVGLPLLRDAAALHSGSARASWGRSGLLVQPGTAVSSRERAAANARAPSSISTAGNLLLSDTRGGHLRAPVAFSQLCVDTRVGVTPCAATPGPQARLAGCCFAQSFPNCLTFLSFSLSFFFPLSL